MSEPSEMPVRREAGVVTLADSTRHDAAMWRRVMERDNGDPRTVERLRITAQRAIQDWLAER